MDNDRIDTPRRRATVHDVASAAGVSLATVDRVLNGRPGVTEATTSRVREAVTRLGFLRDDTAARLATRRRTDILFLLPPAGTNGFMDKLRQAIAAEGERVAAERVFLAVRTTAGLDDDLSLARELDAVDPSAFRGVATVALDSEPVRLAIARAEARGLRIVTLVSDAPASGRTAYVGIDNMAAGRVAGTLLGRFIARRPAEIGLLIGSRALRDHAERAAGLAAELAERFPGIRLLEAREGRDDHDRTEAEASAMLASHPSLAGLYNAGAGNRGLLAAIRRSGRAGALVVVTHELTPHARQGLVDGEFVAVLHQDQTDEVRQAIALLRSPSDDLPIEAGRRPIRLEIFLEHNLPPLPAPP